MKLASLAVAGVTLVGLAAPALAQSVSPEVALTTSRYGNMKCAAFAAMSPRHRDAIVREMTMSAPPQSLSSPVISPGVNSTGQVIVQHDRDAVAGTPLTAGRLIAACQGTSAGMTLRAAFMQATSGRLTIPVQ